MDLLFKNEYLTIVVIHHQMLLLLLNNKKKYNDDIYRYGINKIQKEIFFHPFTSRNIEERYK